MCSRHWKKLKEEDESGGQKITLITIEISRNLHWASMATETEINTKI
jgi:hypothetical protein